eukprot:tig00020564_g11433.t1
MVLHAFKFEVHGRVQGVYFRKYTREKAVSLKLVGWCRNTPSDTVEGEVQGEEKAIKDMEHWLGHVGSPSSKISKLDVRDRRTVAAAEFRDFEIRK